MPGAVRRKITLASQEREGGEEKPLEEMKDQVVHDFSRLGELLQLRGHHKAAVVEYENGDLWIDLRYALKDYVQSLGDTECIIAGD